MGLPSNEYRINPPPEGRGKGKATEKLEKGGKDRWRYIALFHDRLELRKK